jgi:excisionase family DNA binding protein
MMKFQNGPRLDAENWLKDEALMVSQQRACEILGVSVRTLLRMRSTGVLRFGKLSAGRAGKVRIPKAELIRFLTEIVR